MDGGSPACRGNSWDPALASLFPARGLEQTTLSVLPPSVIPTSWTWSLHCGSRGHTSAFLSPGKCHAGGNQLPPGLSSLLGDSGSPALVLLGRVAAKATNPKGQTLMRGH